MSVRISLSSILTRGVHPLTHLMFYCVWLRREQLHNMIPCDIRVTPLYTIFSIILRVHYLLACTSTQKIHSVHEMPCMFHGTMGSINTHWDLYQKHGPEDYADTPIAVQIVGRKWECESVMDVAERI
jgi:hypothetical protein